MESWMEHRWNNIMVDLETMSRRPDAAIVSIGAVAFDVDKGLGPEFYVVVDLESAQQLGCHIGANTVMWWLEQEKSARAYLSAENKGLPFAMYEFQHYLLSICNTTHDEMRIWGHGATFDNVILKSAFKALDRGIPWSHRGDMCFRTLAAMFPDIRVEHKGVKHHALDDAKYQAEHAVAILRHIRDLKSTID
jgi:exodeoxyribonuclease VIII